MNNQTSTPLKSRIDHCYALAENGSIELAQEGLQLAVEEFRIGAYRTFLEDPASVLQSIERTSARIGVDVAFQYAEDFYKEGDKGAARGWLGYSKMHAKKIGLDISDRVSEMKKKYSDRMPLFIRK